MQIKICGITLPQEIEELNILKPDYIGFVFAESKRKIDGFKAQALISKLDKSIKTVGVFRKNSLEDILDVIKIADIDVIQLHGDEDNDFIERLRQKTDKEIWKAVSITTKDDIIKAESYKVDTLLLDGGNPGSGETFAWQLINELPKDKRIFLAGGINENNVLQGIERVSPYGIDVSSGVETITEDGIRNKDKVKMERLIKMVRQVSIFFCII